MHVCKYCVIVLFTVGFTKVTAQQNFDFAVGIGILELPHVAARYQIKQVKIGLGVGAYKQRNIRELSSWADVYYHFGGNSKHTDVRPWFARGGFHYNFYESESSIINETWIQVTMGREFNITKRLGIAVDAGMAKRITFKEEFKKPIAGWNLFDFPEWPAVSFQLFYRLN